VLELLLQQEVYHVQPLSANDLIKLMSSNKRS